MFKKENNGTVAAAATFLLIPLVNLFLPSILFLVLGSLLKENLSIRYI